MGISALAQEIPTDSIDTVKFEQNETVNGYLLASEPTVNVGLTINIAGNTYDLSAGEVVTTFGKAPAEPTAVEKVGDDLDVIKVLRNGQVLLLHGDNTYNAQGILVE